MAIHIEVDILEALEVCEIGRRFAAAPATAGDLLLFGLPRQAVPTPVGPAIWYSGDLESDLGAWLVETRIDGERTVVLAGDWSGRHEMFHAGKRRLSEAEARWLDALKRGA